MVSNCSLALTLARSAFVGDSLTRMMQVRACARYPAGCPRYYKYMRSWQTSGRDVAAWAKKQQPVPRYILLGSSGLHTLWSPGAREFSSWCHQDRDVAAMFDSIAAFIEDIVHELAAWPRPPVLLVSLTTHICDQAFGVEGEVLRAFLEQRPINLTSWGNESTTMIAEWANNNRLAWQNQNVPARSYEPWLQGVISGTIVSPVPWEHCVDGGSETITFNDNGARTINAFLLDLVARLSTGASGVDVHIVDTWNATAGHCDRTRDGRHYDDYVNDIELEHLRRTICHARITPPNRYQLKS